MLALYIIAGLLVLGAALLSVPVDLAFRAEYSGKAAFNARLRWFFGLLSFSLVPGKERHAQKAKPQKKKAPSKGPGFKAFLEIITTRGLVRRFFLLVMESIRQLRFRDFDAEIHAGLDDPADTGMLFAVIGPVTPFLPRSVRIRPGAGAAVFQGRIRCAVRIIPLLYVLVFLRFLFSRPVLTAIVKTIRLWRRNRKRDRPRLDTAEPVPS